LIGGYPVAMPRSSPTAPGVLQDIERIICASVLTRPQAPYAEMERIRQTSMRHNQRLAIHAALMCQSGWYVHWMEGPGPAVRAMRERVAGDNRHHTQLLVHHSRGPRNLLTHWSMMLNPSAEPPAVFGRRVSHLHESMQRGIQYPPTSVIRRLLAPLRIGLADASETDPEAFHRVGVSSADDGRGFDLVRWLARTQGIASEARRVAGEDDLDSGSEYVEFRQDGTPCRVIAVSRAGLRHGLRRAFLPDWGNLVLLFGDDAKRNRALMQRVVDACTGLPAHPDLLGVAADPAVHARKAAAARAAGLRYHQLGLMRAEESEEVWHAVRERLQHLGPPRGSQWDAPPSSWLP
jgi:hypothetical protein